MAKVEIYCDPFCPYCTRAKKLLDSKNVDYEEIDVMVQPKRRVEMRARADGRNSVPQIFIDGVGIGGCDELHALDDQGRLAPLLAGAV